MTSELQEGDEVRVTFGFNTGETGRVVRAPWRGSLTVRLGGCERGYDVSEVELIESEGDACGVTRGP